MKRGEAQLIEMMTSFLRVSEEPGEDPPEDQAPKGLEKTEVFLTATIYSKIEIR